MSLPNQAKLRGWENFLRKWCESRGVVLSIFNDWQYWTLRGDGTFVDWWPSTGKWKSGDGSHGQASHPTQLVEVCAADRFPADTKEPVDEDRPEEPPRDTPHRTVMSLTEKRARTACRRAHETLAFLSYATNAVIQRDKDHRDAPFWAAIWETVQDSGVLDDLELGLEGEKKDA